MKTYTIGTSWKRLLAVSVLTCTISVLLSGPSQAESTCSTSFCSCKMTNGTCMGPSSKACWDGGGIVGSSNCDDWCKSNGNKHCDA
jgi:hypothetical protein